MQNILHLIYPAQCLICDARVERDFALCGPCRRETPFLAGLMCDSCAAPLPGTSDRAEHCDACLLDPPPWAQGRAALQYGGMARRLVLALKHGDRTDLAKPAARWLVRAADDLLQGDPLLTPVPLHRWRLLKRRYNQSALIAREMARLADCDLCPDLLTRPKRTPSLDHLSRDERRAVLDGAITPHPRRSAKGRHVVIVDDVMTSGATLRAATHAAFDAGAAKVSVAILARVVKEA